MVCNFRGVFFAFSTLISVGSSSALQAQVRDRPLKPKNVIAPTTDNYCKGLAHVFAITKQVLSPELAVLCSGGTATPIFGQVLDMAYQGIGEPTFTAASAGDGLEISSGVSELFVTYALRVDRNPAQNLLAEEKNLTNPYKTPSQGSQPDTILTIASKFNAPPVNTGYADTAFTVEQHVRVENERLTIPNDKSLYDLRMYRLYPDNLDFFLAARTLQSPAASNKELFRYSTVLRAILPDPKNPNFTFNVTVLHFQMNNQGRHPQMVDEFRTFIRNDTKNLYAAIRASAP